MAPASTVFINGEAWEPNEAVIVEEKSTRQSVFYVSGPRAKEQYAEALRLAREGRNVAYGIRWKTGAREDRWEFFPVDPSRDHASPMRRGQGRTLSSFFALPGYIAPHS